jgi:HSP20 family protein
MTLMSTYSSWNVDRLFEEALLVAGHPQTWSPASDVYEDEHSFRIEAALPGFGREAVEITFEDSILTIKDQRKEEMTENRKYFLREIMPGRFSRSFQMPTTIDASTVSATVKDGVLTVQLLKRADTKLRRIRIQ